MRKLYGTLICPDTPPAISYLVSIGYDFDFVDITLNTTNLKEFLSLRDKREEFKEVVENGYIGIPCLIDENDKVYFEDDIYEIK